MKRIVAEVTKNWLDLSDEPGTGTTFASMGREAFEPESVLAQRFEKVIEVNLERGYVLESWQYQMVAHPRYGSHSETVICESIIAVFIQAIEASYETKGN